MSTLTAEPRYPQEREAEVVLRDGATVHVRPVRTRRRPGDSRVSRELSRRSRSRSDSSARRTSTGPRRGRSTSITRTATGWSPRAGARGRSWPTPRTCGSTRRAPRWPSSSPMPGRDGGSRRSCSPTSPRRPRAAGHHDVRRRGAAAQPPHDRRLPPERVPGRAALDPRRARDRAAHSLSAEALERFEERERIACGGGGRAASSQPRSVAVIGASRRRGTIGGEILAQPARGASSTARCTRSTTRPTWCSRARVPVGARHPGRGRAGGGRRACPAGRRGVARECAAAGVQRAAGDLGRLRRDRRRGRPAPARAARRMPRRRHAARRAQLPRACSTPSPTSG